MVCNPASALRAPVACPHPQLFNVLCCGFAGLPGLDRDVALLIAGATMPCF